MAEALEQAIRENAAGPKKAQGDAGSVEQHDLADQIEADRYLASKEAATAGACEGDQDPAARGRVEKS